MHTYIRTCVRTYIHTYICIYIYIYTHTCVYIFVQTQDKQQNRIYNETRPSLNESIPAAEFGQAPRAAPPRCTRSRAPHPGKTKKPAAGALAKVARSLLWNTRSENGSLECSLIQFTPCRRTSTQTAVRTMSSKAVACINMRKLRSPERAQRQSDKEEVPSTKCRNTGQKA